MGDQPQAEPVTDFGKDDARRKMAYAIADNAENLGLDHPLWIGGRRVTLAATVETRDPSSPQQVVSIFPAAGAEQVAQAVESALRGNAEVQALPADARADLLRRAAEALRPRRFELCAWSCFEAGLTWREADVDFADALDGLERAAAAVRPEMRSSAPLVLAAGDALPLSSLAGPLAYQLARGGAAIVLAGPQAPLVQWRLVEALLDAGLPGEALQFLAGAEAAGPLAFDDRIVLAPPVDDDSMPAPLRAAWPVGIGAREKLVIVLEGADPDATARGIADSACARAGRHPAGGGRILLVGSEHGDLTTRIGERAREREPGPAIDFSTDLGPLPDEARFATWRRALESAASAPTQRGNLPDDAQARREGWFAGPQVWTGLTPDDPLWRRPPTGPAIVLARVADFDEALAVRAGLAPGRTVLCGATSEQERRVSPVRDEEVLEFGESGLAPLRTPRA